MSEKTQVSLSDLAGKEKRCSTSKLRSSCDACASSKSYVEKSDQSARAVSRPLDHVYIVSPTSLDVHHEPEVAVI